jgi:2-methylcitrate dehydratase PrpD
LGATAGIANMLRLDVETTRSALGLCYSQLSGTMQAHVEGSPMLPLQIGVNTRAALLAIDLATRGVQGPRHFLEGDFGYFTLFDSEWDPSAFDQLGQRQEIEQLSHKPFPSGRATHGGVDGALTLQQALGFSVAEIEELRVYAPPLVVQLVDRPAHSDMLPAYARLCLPYVVATALLTGDVTVGDFDAAALRSPERLTLAHRIRVLRDDNPSLNALAPQRVEVQLRSGHTEQLPLPAVLGAPGRPLTRERHLAKFRRAAAAGVKPLSEQSISKVIQLVDELPAISDMPCYSRTPHDLPELFRVVRLRADAAGFPPGNRLHGALCQALARRNPSASRQAISSLCAARVGDPVLPTPVGCSWFDERRCRGARRHRETADLRQVGLNEKPGRTPTVW